MVKFCRAQQPWNSSRTLVSIRSYFSDCKHHNQERVYSKEKTHHYQDKSKFIEDFIRKFRSINTVIITDKLPLESIVQEYADIAESTWYLYS